MYAAPRVNGFRVYKPLSRALLDFPFNSPDTMYGTMLYRGALVDEI